LKIVFKRRRRISHLSAVIKPIAYNLLFTNSPGLSTSSINPIECINSLRDTYGIRATAKMIIGSNGKLNGYKYKNEI